MKERPIIFSAPMVRAILDGRKTQTRRIAKGVVARNTNTGEALREIDSAGPRVACPYGQVGDRLWVRETFCMDDNGHEEWPVYAADGDALPARPAGCGISRWRPSIHMPRSASRITLEITDVRVERLREIGEGDAIAEGWPKQTDPGAHTGGNGGPFDWFRGLWAQINGADSWGSNPWVWVIEFRRITTEDGK